MATNLNKPKTMSISPILLSLLVANLSISAGFAQGGNEPAKEAAKPATTAKDGGKDGAKTTKPGAKTTRKPGRPPVSLPKFKTPPGKAQRKGSAGTRAEGDPVKVAVLTPETFGSTYSAQPSFFWYQSEPSKPRQVTINIYEGFEKLAKVRLPQAYGKGVQRVDLASLKVSLSPDKTYNWSITYETNRRSPSLNAVSKGMVKFTPPSADTATALEGADAGSSASIYAKSGVWHDLLGALDDLRKEDPDSAAAKALWDSVLKDVGLGDL
jgi:hypothetical protein